jgi:hypothetical protein
MCLCRLVVNSFRSGDLISVCICACLFSHSYDFWIVEYSKRCQTLNRNKIKSRDLLKRRLVKCHIDEECGHDFVYYDM